MKIITPFFIVTSLLLSPAIYADDNKNKSGEELFKTYCAACHGANIGGMDMSKRVAPPIAAVKLHYIGTYPDQTSFVEAISGWIEKQDAEKSLMRGAINKFKIMPPIVVPKDDMKKIATYIYKGEIENPKGFDQHVEENHGKAGLKKMQGMEQGTQMHMGGMHKKMQEQHKASVEDEKGTAGKQYHAKKQHRMNKMMQKLNLTEQQRQQMQLLIKQKTNRLRPLKKEMYQIKKTIRQLDTTRPDYQAQVFSLANATAQRIYQMILVKGEMKMKIESLLSPEQRVKLKKLNQ